MRISDWSSDVCSSDLDEDRRDDEAYGLSGRHRSVAPAATGTADRFLVCDRMEYRADRRGTADTRPLAVKCAALASKNNVIKTYLEMLISKWPPIWPPKDRKSTRLNSSH